MSTEQPAQGPPPARPRAAQPPPAPTRRRVAALLRSPVGLRQAIVAKEILDPPLALRRRRLNR
jgi:hypothetical protein